MLCVETLLWALCTAGMVPRLCEGVHVKSFSGLRREGVSIWWPRGCAVVRMCRGSPFRRSCATTPGVVVRLWGGGGKPHSTRLLQWQGEGGDRLGRRAQ